MKIALIGDVHANLPALEAVLEHAEGAGAEAIWNVGDFVGYNAFPEQVIERLRQVGAVSIVGNYDLKVLKFPKKDKKWRRKKLPEKYLAFKWAYENLSDDSRSYLASLPQQERLMVEGWQVLLTHGSPASIDEHIYEDTPEQRFRELAELAAADVVVCGHSHRPFVRVVDDTWFVNTGSVGRLDDGDPRTCYALMEAAAGRLEVSHHRLAYDLEAAVEGIRRQGLPEAFEQMLREGRKLDWVLGERDGDSD